MAIYINQKWPNISNFIGFNVVDMVSVLMALGVPFKALTLLIILFKFFLLSFVRDERPLHLVTACVSTHLTRNAQTWTPHRHPQPSKPTSLLQRLALPHTSPETPGAGGDPHSLSPLQLQTPAVTEGHQSPSSLLNLSDTHLLIAAVVPDRVTPAIVQVTRILSPLTSPHSDSSSPAARVAFPILRI